MGELAREAPGPRTLAKMLGFIYNRAMWMQQTPPGMLISLSIPAAQSSHAESKCSYVWGCFYGLQTLYACEQRGGCEGQGIFSVSLPYGQTSPGKSLSAQPGAGCDGDSNGAGTVTRDSTVIPCFGLLEQRHPFLPPQGYFCPGLLWWKRPGEKRGRCAAGLPQAQAVFLSPWQSQSGLRNKSVDFCNH